MHILHIAYSCGPESAGGRLCKALKNAGCRISTLALEPPAFPDTHIVLPFGSSFIQKKILIRLGKVPFLLYPRRNRNIPWSTHLFGNDLSKTIQSIRPDIIHLHWIAASTLSLRCLQQISVPIVWTFHDTWPLTAGCHCFFDCTQWQYNCRYCPQLKNGIFPVDFGFFLWKHKYSALRQTKITVVAPSRWMANTAQKSSLWRNRHIEHIPNALDINDFSPCNKEIARLKLNIPKDKKVILFGATGIDLYYKGFDLLVEALGLLQRKYSNLYLLAFGSLPSHFNKVLPIKATFTGLISDHRQLIELYNSADVYVAPSRQDNLNTTLLEASACNIPCVAFNIGGMADIIHHMETGYLAKPFEISDLAYGIEMCLYSPIAKAWGGAARQHCINTFESSLIAKRHIDLYTRLLSRNTL